MLVSIIDERRMKFVLFFKKNVNRIFKSCYSGEKNCTFELLSLDPLSIGCFKSIFYIAVLDVRKKLTIFEHPLLKITQSID